MTTIEQVTNFVLRRDWWTTSTGKFAYLSEAMTATNTPTEHIKRTPSYHCDICRAAGVNFMKEDCRGTLHCEHSVEMATVADLCKALTAHLKSLGLEPEEYGFNAPVAIRHGEQDAKIPAKHRWLIAFVVEGNSEGFYIHLAAVVESSPKRELVDLGLAKTYSPQNAYAIAREAQRFLTAAAWN